MKARTETSLPLPEEVGYTRGALAMKPSTIRLAGVGRRWQSRVALADVTLTVPAGQRVALIGPSGSGKTTLLRLMMAALRATSGEIHIGDSRVGRMNPAEIRAHRRRCALVDQGLQVLPGLSVHDNVIAGRVASWPWWKTLASTFVRLDTDDVASLLADVGLRDRQWDIAETLSGGQKQRVAIARALASSPAILFADEPTAALDPATAREGVALLAEESRKRGATLILCTHQAELVLPAVDRVIGLREGRVVLDAASEDVTPADLDRLYASANAS